LVEKTIIQNHKQNASVNSFDMALPHTLGPNYTSATKKVSGTRAYIAL